VIEHLYGFTNKYILKIVFFLLPLFIFSTVSVLVFADKFQEFFFTELYLGIIIVASQFI